MQYIKNIKPIWYLIVVFFFCGLKPSNSTISVQKNTTYSLKNLSDTLQYLDEWQIDYGFNDDIDLYGNKTYKLYKKFVKHIPSGGFELEIRTKNSQIGIVFYNQEIQQIQYSSLKTRLQRGKILHKKNNYISHHLNIQIGDSLSYCLKKLGRLNFAIEHPSQTETYLKVDGLVKFNEIKKGVGNCDEYHCIYGFENNKLDFIEINYYRNFKKG